MQRNKRTVAAAVAQGSEQLILDVLGLAALTLISALALAGW